MKFEFALILAMQLMTCSLCGILHGAERPEITGTVTDSAGKPLVGVRIDISTASPKVGRGIFCPSCYLDCGKWARTDRTGSFKLTKLDPNLKFRLVIASPQRKTLQTKLIDPSAGPVNLVLQPLPKNIDPKLVVSGVVVNEEGTPVAAASVSPHGAKTPTRSWVGLVKDVEPTVTDEQGRFTMIVPKNYLELDIRVVGNGFCGAVIKALKPGDEPVEVSVTEGAQVTGRLVDNGKPVVNTTVAVVQTDRGSNHFFIAAIADVTDKNGQFEFRNLPSDQQYCIYSVVGDANRTKTDHVLTVKTFKVPESGKTRDVGSLEVSEPISIRGRVVRVDGKPLPQNLRLTFGREPAWDLIAIPVAKDGSFAANGLPPETFEIRVGDRNLAVVANRMRYQMLGASSFGVYAQESLENLVISVKGK